MEFGPGPSVLVGANGNGKSNLIEAVHRVATGGSYRAANDAPLVRRDASAAYIRVGLDTDAGRRRTVELELRPGKGSRSQVDGAPVRRTSDAVGVLRAVLFAPEDLAIVRGDPSERRRFLDELLGQRRPAYAAARSEYERALRQRNRLLRTAHLARGTAIETLDAWTTQLARHGALLVAARAAAVTALAGPVSAWLSLIHI